MQKTEIKNLKKNQTFKHKGKIYQYEKLLKGESEVYLIQEHYSNCKVRLPNDLKVEVVQMVQ